MIKSVQVMSAREAAGLRGRTDIDLLPVGTCSQVGGVHVCPAQGGHKATICGGPHARVELDVTPRRSQWVALSYA